MTVTVPPSERVSRRLPRGRFDRPPAGALPPEVGAQDKELRARVNTGFAAIALILLSPLLVVIAVAVKLTSKGPIIYCQPRVGIDRRHDGNKPEGSRRVADLGGKPFRIYKFRTMTVDAEQRGAVWASAKDPRVTRIGRFLRTTRLDELPQLLNVLWGDMSIVGPRPERPAIFADLRGKVENYELRQRAKPGITGLAQISQSYDTCIEDVRSKVGHDLRYIERQGLKEDLVIILKTIPVVLFRRGGW